MQLRPVKAAKAAVQRDLSTYVAYHREALLWLARLVASRLTNGPEPLHEARTLQTRLPQPPSIWTLANYIAIHEASLRRIWFLLTETG